MKIESKIILAALKNHLTTNFGNSVKEVILFGSQVTGDSQKFSDYDLLIVLENDYSGKDENTIFDLCYDIDLKFDILLDVHIISVKELNSVRGRQPVFQKAINREFTHDCLYNYCRKRQRRDSICRKNAVGVLKGAAHRNQKGIAVRCTLFL